MTTTSWRIDELLEAVRRDPPKIIWNQHETKWVEVRVDFKLEKDGRIYRAGRGRDVPPECVEFPSAVARQIVKEQKGTIIHGGYCDKGEVVRTFQGEETRYPAFRPWDTSELQEQGVTPFAEVFLRVYLNQMVQVIPGLDRLWDIGPFYLPWRNIRFAKFALETELSGLGYVPNLVICEPQ